MVLGFGGPEMIGQMRSMFDQARAERDPEQVVSPGHINDEFVALCPTVLMDDRDKAFTTGRGRFASSPLCIDRLVPVVP